MPMNGKASRKIQKISSCGISLFAGFGVYLAAANDLGVARLPALLVAAAAAAVLAAIYWLLLRRAAPLPDLSWWYLLPAVAVLLIVSVNYSGLISLWRDMAVNETPFPVYSLLAASLLLLAGWRGEQAVNRACPVVAAVVIAAIIIDTLLVLPKADPQLLAAAAEHSPQQLLRGGGEMALFLLAPAAVFAYGAENLTAADRKPLSLRFCLTAWGLTLLYLLLEQVRNLLLFGELIALDQYPLLRTLKSVDFGVGISRLEFLGVSALSAGILIALMLEFAVLVGICRRLNGKIAAARRAVPLVLTASVLGVSSLIYCCATQTGLVIIVLAALALLLAAPMLRLVARRRG